MTTRLSLEKKHDLLQNRLDENLKKKRSLELKINEQFEKLKKMEMQLEKTMATQASRTQYRYCDYADGRRDKKTTTA
jgi:hypothetical protein